ncbi:hypothetical protein [Conexibacter woesei]|uniref:hypothetical protein n=1 Tax=Conexibacter woesei TaxID=191495 RepID=UPI00040CA54B|nr:hypothetical protein [Conexibacter woesei]
MRRSALSGCCALILLALPATAGAQDAVGGLTFRDARPLTIATTAIGTPATAQLLKVCNTGARPLTRAKASAGDFGFKTRKGVAAGTVLATPAVHGTSGRIPPGACRAIDLPPGPGLASLVPGSYEGVLTVFAAPGGFARRTVTITLAAKASATHVPQSVTDTVNIKVVHNHFWPFRGGTGDQTRHVVLKAPPVSPPPTITGRCSDGERAPSQDCPAIGIAAHNEDTALISVGGATPRTRTAGAIKLPVRIHVGDGVGDYQGTIDPAATGVADDAIPVTVSVTDSWKSALYALLIGCLLALLPQLIARRWKPMIKARGQAKGLIDCYAVAGETFRGAEPPRFPLITGPIPSTEVRAYADEIRTAIRRYDNSMVFLDTSTAAFREIQASIDNARADAQCWAGPGGLHDALAKLETALARVQAWLGSHDFAPQGPAVAETAAAILTERKLDIGEALGVVADADAATALLKDWTALATRLLVLQLWWRRLAQVHARLNEDDAEMFMRSAARIIQCKRELVRATDAEALAALGVRARVGRIYEDLAYLGGRLDVGEPGPNDPPGELRGQWGGLGIAESDAEWLKQNRNERAGAGTAEAVADLVESVDKAPVSRDAAQVAEIGRTWQILGDVVCIVLALLVTIVAALLALVNGKNFGTTGDYLTVIVVGAAAQATISSIVPRFNTFLSDLLGTPLERAAEPAGDG